MQICASFAIEFEDCLQATFSILFDFIEIYSPECPSARQKLRQKELKVSSLPQKIKFRFPSVSVTFASICCDIWHVTS